MTCSRKLNIHIQKHGSRLTAVNSKQVKKHKWRHDTSRRNHLENISGHQCGLSINEQVDLSQTKMFLHSQRKIQRGEEDLWEMFVKSLYDKE